MMAMAALLARFPELLDVFDGTEQFVCSHSSTEIPVLEAYMQ